MPTWIKPVASGGGAAYLCIMTHPFYAIHTHGLIRVAAATPRASVGDTCANAKATIALAREADAKGVDLVVFPELNLTSYAIDDLHLQTAQQRATLAAIATVVEASAPLRPVLLVGAALVRNGRLHNCALAIARGRVLGVVPKTFLPNYREFYEKRWFASGAGLTGLTIDLDGAEVPFGTDLIFAARDLPGFVVHAEICEDYWAPTPPSTAGALAGALICCNFRVEHRHRQGTRAGDAGRVAVRAGGLCLCLFRRGTGRKHDRGRMGWPGPDPRTRRADCGVGAVLD